MKKILITFNAILFLVFFSLPIRADEPFKCTSQYQLLIEKDNDFISFVGRLNFFLTDDTEGFFNIMGTVKTKEHSYWLSRSSYFSLSPNETNKVKAMKITKVVKHSIDSTPEDIWSRDILIDSPGVEFHIEMAHLKDNAILIKSINTPHLICAKK
ncbi:FidL-like protein [Serratia quinivorans]|uniref:FidL-like protein n=1 Tax=Serratia quinivorans TaxID=137545 RepID=UPI002E7A9120|nr:FidL-like protein [Serratia quinivorans]